MRDVEHFLREADLVKFARATPDPEQCEAALSAVEQIVIRTVPGRPAAGQAPPPSARSFGVDAPIQDPALLAPPPGDAPLTESATAKLDGESSDTEKTGTSDDRERAPAAAGEPQDEPVDEPPDSGRKL